MICEYEIWYLFVKFIIKYYLMHYQMYWFCYEFWLIDFDSEKFCALFGWNMKLILTYNLTIYQNPINRDYIWHTDILPVGVVHKYIDATSMKIVCRYIDILLVEAMRLYINTLPVKFVCLNIDILLMKIVCWYINTLLMGITY